MKKVRFETPNQLFLLGMDESECQSPRPFFEREAASAPDIYQPHRIIYSNDPVHRFEYSDSSPYPLAKKTLLPINGNKDTNWLPSSELNLSMLDCHEPRSLCKQIYKPVVEPRVVTREIKHPEVLASKGNSATPPNVLSKNDSFFIRRTNLDKYHIGSSMADQFDGLGLDKENMHKKVEMIKKTVQSHPVIMERNIMPQVAQSQGTTNSDCMCHHCNIKKPAPCTMAKPVVTQTKFIQTHPCQFHCQTQVISCPHCELQAKSIHRPCSCSPRVPESPKNSVDKKTWAIEKYEGSKKEQCLEVEKQTNLVKEKQEPTIADLVKIIKLQNEQLQLLQEKVDKFISTSNNQAVQIPVQNYVKEHVALQAIESEHKISIGVMTSFEMVRTSTVINKEVLTQKTDNAQIQCNRSQISIKEVVSKQPVNLNFLEGISPTTRLNTLQTEPENVIESVGNNEVRSNPQQIGNEEKTLNELSLYNVQVDNATTPLISPEQSLYLDVRDYSSDSSEEKSNVGWTYYNKVMTHVNGMLEDSDMPSSASALYRNTRQQCVQMQIDKTNVSVTKRVKFGDDPFGIQQPHINAGSTDTSLKMTQLAAKYLKSAPQRNPRPTTTANPVEMSFATRNYMERHKILQGPGATSKSPQQGEIPRFLDITALKRQPKFL